MNEYIKKLCLIAGYIFAALVIAELITGCAAQNTKEIEARLEKIEAEQQVLIKAYDEAAKVVTEHAEIINNQTEAINKNADFLKGAIEVLKLHDADIEELKKQNNETHF